MLSEQSLPLGRQKLLEIWSSVLGIDVFDPDEDFFSAGGDSLKATTLMAEIYKVFGLSFEESALFWAPRFDDFLEAVLTAADAATGNDPVESLRINQD